MNTNDFKKSLDKYRTDLMADKECIEDIIKNPIYVEFIKDCRNIDEDSINQMIKEELQKLQLTSNPLEKNDIKRKIIMLILSTIDGIDLEKFKTK